MVPGILYIVFSGLEAFGTIAGLVYPGNNSFSVGYLSVQNGVPALSSINGPQTVPAEMSGFVTAALIVMIATSSISLIISIIAVLNANKPEKAKTVIVVSLILIACVVLSFIFALISALTVGQLIDILIAAASLVAGLILPILILVGGKKNQAYKSEQKTVRQ